MPPTLKQAVQEALEAYPPLRASRAELSVKVDDSQVTLAGYVPSQSIKELAAVLAGSVQGVTQVVNEVWAAPDLERAVAMALAADSRTRLWPIRVRAELGTVQLQGRVPDEESMQAALEVARQVKGPRQITSALKM